MPKHTLLFFLFVITLISGCGGGGGASTSGGLPPNTIPPPSISSQATALASIQSGGATEFSLDNGSIVYADYNRGEILKVSSNGGEIKTLYANSSTSPGELVNAAGKLYVLNTQTAGGLFSLADNSIGVETLVRMSGNWPQDISCDGTYVYWSSGSNVYRTKLTLNITNSVETIFSGGAGCIARLALDGGSLYISDSANRKLFRINTGTLSREALLTFSGTPTYDTSQFDIPLSVDSNHIYALIDSRYIHSISKSSQQETIIPSTFQSFYNVKIITDNSGMYWWDQSVANQLTLKKNDSATGNVNVLLSIPFTWNLDATISDGAYIYWFEHEFSATGDYVYNIKKVSTSGGNAELVASYISDININGALIPRSVSIDANNIYWSSSTTNLIAKINKSGGAPVIISRFDTYSAVTTINGFILAANDGNITKIPINGVSPVISEWAQPNTSSSNPSAMTKDDVNIYWAIQNSATATEIWGTFDVYFKPISGGAVKKIATIPGYANRFYSFSDSLIFIKSTLSGGAISSIPKIGGAESTLIVATGGQPSDLQIVGSMMYFLAEGVYSLNLVTNELKALVNQNDTNRIYVDGINIYWTQAVGGGGGVYKMAIAGGIAHNLYNGSSWKITGDVARIYWATGFQILSMDKF